MVGSSSSAAIPSPPLPSAFLQMACLLSFSVSSRSSYFGLLGVQIDGWAAKQVLHAQVHLSPFTHIHVITTHTQADYAFNASNTKNAATR